MMKAPSALSESKSQTQRPITHALRVTHTLDVLVDRASREQVEGFWNAEFDWPETLGLANGFTISRENLEIAGAVEDGEQASLDYPKALVFIRRVRDELPSADEYFFYARSKSKHRH